MRCWRVTGSEGISPRIIGCSHPDPMECCTHSIFPLPEGPGSSSRVLSFGGSAFRCGGWSSFWPVFSANTITRKQLDRCATGQVIPVVRGIGEVWTGSAQQPHPGGAVPLRARGATANLYCRGSRCQGSGDDGSEAGSAPGSEMGIQPLRIARTTACVRSLTAILRRIDVT